MPKLENKKNLPVSQITKPKDVDLKVKHFSGMTFDKRQDKKREQKALVCRYWFLAASYREAMSGTGNSIYLSPTSFLPQHRIFLLTVYKLATLSPWILSSGSVNEKVPHRLTHLNTWPQLTTVLGEVTEHLRFSLAEKDITEQGLWEFVAIPHFLLFLSAPCGHMRCDLSDFCSATHCHTTPAVTDFSSETINPERLPFPVSYFCHVILLQQQKSN